MTWVVQISLLLAFLCFLQCSEIKAQERRPSDGQYPSEGQSQDHEWHEKFAEEHDADVIDDKGLHDIADTYQDFFGQDKWGRTDINMTAVMLSAERQRGRKMDTRGPGIMPTFTREPVIPNTILKRLSPDMVQNMTADDVLQLQRATEMSYESLAHLLKYLRPEEFDKFLGMARNSTDFENQLPDPSVAKAVIDSCHRQWGPVSGWTWSQVARLGPMLTGLNIEQIKQLNQDALPQVIETFARLKYRGQEARTLVLRAKRSWGDIRTWGEHQLRMLGPFVTFLSPRDLKQIQPQNLTSLLPVLGSYEFERGQARAIISAVKNQPEWQWTSDEVQSLGKLRTFLNPAELKAALGSVVASPDILKEMMPSEGRGHQQQTREIAKVLKESKGSVSAWDAEDFKSMGRAASGLEVDDLEQLDPSVVQGAIADIADAEYSPRQRKVLVEKYRKAKGNQRAAMSAAEVREMKGLAAGLTTSDLAGMDPVDVRESVDIFAQNAKRMRKTQKKEIIKQLRDAPGGIQDAIQDMGDMVKELPLKDFDSLCTANFTASADRNATGVAAAGRLNWTDGQSMKLFRCFKDEVLGGEGGGSASPLTQSTIRYMGSMAKGMTCEDIDGFYADDILPTVGAMMEQKGWSPRQLDCIHRKVRTSLSQAHSDYTADFTEMEISSLTGQLLKEFRVEELNSIPTSHCEMIYSEIGGEDLMALKLDKRKALTTNALQCLGSDGGEDTIEQDTIDIIGNLACDLDASALRRLSSSAFTGNLYEVQKCCLDIGQREVIGERLVEEMGSPNQWKSDAISDVGPLLVSMSDNYIQSLDEDEFALVAEDMMIRFAEYKEKWRQFCDIDLKPEDIESRDNGFVAVAIKAKDALVAAAQAETARRKRRQSTYSPTCTEIESLGDGNIAWTVDELEAMTVNTFDSCGYALGEVAGFSEAQLGALLNKAKEAWGEAGDMAPDQVSQLGHIVSALTPAEIGQLNLTEMDTVYAISQYDIYTPEQLDAGVGRFLELTGLAIASLDSLDLTALGNFLCGLTTAEMADISSAAYQESANAIGELRSCDTSQWAALNAKAVEGFGNTSTWMPEEFTEVGSVVAGFSAEELSSLSAASIAGIKPHAVSLIPPQTLADGWSATQLGQLDQPQAEAVTDEQYSTLSQDQRAALQQAEYGDDVGLAGTEETLEETTAEDDTIDDSDGDGAGYQSGRIVPAIVFMCYLIHMAI